MDGAVNEGTRGRGVGAVCLALREREVRVGRGEEIDRIERLSAYIAYI